MILDDLVAATKRRMKREQATISLAEMQAKAAATPTKDPQLVYDRFNAPGIHLIGEVKKKLLLLRTDCRKLPLPRDCQGL